MKSFPLFLLFVLTSTGLFAQEQVRIMTYNLLNYPGSDTSERNPHYRVIMEEVKPDVLVVQEIQSQEGVDGFLNYVMNSFGLEYQAGVFNNGTDTDNAIFFKTTHFKFISNRPINTALRDINEFTLVHLTAEDTIRIYSVHLKSSTGATNEDARKAEVDSLRKVTNALPAGSDFIICGDFNIYGSTESSYTALLQNTIPFDGHVIDPINMTGTWNSTAYKVYHTQSPRTRSFGGGITGGLDDRFDLILHSSSMVNPGRISYVSGSCQAIGNDGNHYNDSINKQPNSAVSVPMANALHYASDHLPVMSLFLFSNAHNTSLTKKSELKSAPSVYPNPSNSSFFIDFEISNACKVRLGIYDAQGRVIKYILNQSLPAGKYSYPFSPSTQDSSGQYYYRLITPNASFSGKLLRVK